MDINFKNIEYLKSGNHRQKRAFHVLNKLKIFENFKKYNPILTGTIPIEIDIPESDLDIICQCENHLELSNLLIKLFSQFTSFTLKTSDWNGIETTISKFHFDNFEIEIFAQNIPTVEQNAYQHMLIEYKILNQKGKAFRDNIITLKSNGLKTEPAFAKLLGLGGDPYDALLRWNL